MSIECIRSTGCKLVFQAIERQNINKWVCKFQKFLFVGGIFFEGRDEEARGRDLMGLGCSFEDFAYSSLDQVQYQETFDVGKILKKK